MIISILTHTPLWVYGLFLGLVLLGWQQSRTRTVGRTTAFAMPASMMLLSFFGVISSFQPSFLGISLWLLGIAIATAIGYCASSNKIAQYNGEKNSYLIAGSWIPFIFIMAIFFTKYCVGIMLAFDVQILASIEAHYSLSFLYGLLSGIFTSRSIRLWQISTRPLMLVSD